MNFFNRSNGTLWSAAIILCLAAGLFSLIFSSCAKQGGGSLPVTTASAGERGGSGSESQIGLPVDVENPVLTPPAASAEPDAPGETEELPDTPTVRLGETPDAGRAYLDKLIFLGDSTTYGIGYYYDHGYAETLCPPRQIWTPSSGTLTLAYYATAAIVYPDTGEELSIMDAVARAKPEYLVITLGVNGISFMDEEWFIRDYTALVKGVQEASPETKIILNSIYPVTAAYSTAANGIDNDKIRAANTWIEQIAADTGTRFLFSYESVVDADGNLPMESSNDYELHLTGEALTKVMQYVRTHEYR